MEGMGKEKLFSPEGVLPYISHIGMCRPIGWGFCAILVWIRVWFSRELRACMNVFIVSIPNEWERKRNIRIRNGFFCLYSNHVGNDNIISALRPGLKTGMDFRGLVWKRGWKITFFGLKLGQDLKNRAAHPHQEFPGVLPWYIPPLLKLVLKGSQLILPPIVEFYWSKSIGFL